MKSGLIKTGIVIFKGILHIIYAFLKLSPVDDHLVLFCSRQSTQLPLDFRLLQEEIDRRNELLAKEGKPEHQLRYVSVTRYMGSGLKNYIVFLGKMLQSMRYLAKARVCVLDSYWPPVSLLHHKKQLKVIQIWHAIGKIKKSGKASVGEKSGRSQQTAELLDMHRNYDYIIAGAKIWNPFYCESFGCTEDKLLNYGLPRIDYLLQTADANREKFFRENPELKEKKIILYAPTFRRNMESRWTEIIDAVDYEKYTLIIKNHPIQRIYGQRPEGDVYYFDEWKSMDLMAVADYVITDYSAIALEAAVLNKPTLYWAYDYEEYLENNGLNLDLYQVMPGCVFPDIDELMAFIDSGQYDMSLLEHYRKERLPEDLGQSTSKITDLIMEITG